MNECVPFPTPALDRSLPHLLRHKHYITGTIHWRNTALGEPCTVGTLMELCNAGTVHCWKIVLQNIVLLELSFRNTQFLEHCTIGTLYYLISVLLEPNLLL